MKKITAEKVIIFIIMIFGWLLMMDYTLTLHNFKPQELALWQLVILYIGTVNYALIFLLGIALSLVAILLGPALFIVHLFKSEYSIFSKDFWEEIN